MQADDVYNLAFGDYDEETGSIDDTVITNNNDSQKVLATVASTLYVLQTNIQTFGFMQKVVIMQGQDFTELVLLLILKKSLKILKSMV